MSMRRVVSMPVPCIFQHKSLPSCLLPDWYGLFSNYAGNSVDFKVSGQHSPGKENPQAQQSAEKTQINDQGGTEKMKRTNTQPGILLLHPAVCK